MMFKMLTVMSIAALLVPSLSLAQPTTGKAPDAAAPARFVRWIAIGNSITAHGAAEQLKWLGETRGMAASSLQTDYVHVLRRLMQERDAGSAAQVKTVGRLGRLSAGTIEMIETELNAIRDWDADLVTIQLGENDSLATMGRDEFERRYRTVVDGVLANPKKPVIVCTGLWSPTERADAADAAKYAPASEARIKDDLIQAICHEKGLIYASIAPYAMDPANSGFGEDPGVRWHPNDAAMAAYANAIMGALDAAQVWPNPKPAASARPADAAKLAMPSVDHRK